MSTPSIPRGTRDFAPSVVAKRQYLFRLIQGVFEKYGFAPLETPTMENLSVLTGKYGDEGDQLIFKVLNSGDYTSELIAQDKIKEPNAKEWLPHISEKALRYDLTVPFARYVAMNKGQLTFPFKRYQIQPVWRADRPQKGRYREFYQCDADVVGTPSLLCEAEIIGMITEVFKALGIKNYAIKINHRAILSAIAEAIGEKGKEGTLCMGIDKLDKIGKGKVKEELINRGISESASEKVWDYIDISGNTDERLAALEAKMQTIPEGLKGIADIRAMLKFAHAYSHENLSIEVDYSLARGLSYYTGIIFEVKVKDVAIGSASGGGRYDNLTGIFGLKDVSGVGISFGVDRLYDVMLELNLFPDGLEQTVDLMLTHFDAECAEHGMGLLHILRSGGIRCEMYPDAEKIKKQFTYADNKKTPYVLVVGSDEIAKQQYVLKNMQTGNQEILSIEKVISTLKSMKTNLRTPTL